MNAASVVLATTASSETTYRLRCLGPVLVRGPGGDRVMFQTRKHVVLLLHFSMQPGRPVSRDALTDLFWHGDEERKARHSLSQSVSLVNKVLGRDVIVAAGTNRLVLAEGLVWADAIEFEGLVADGQFLEARRLWGGSFLEGFWVPRAPRLEEWIAGERARLDRTFRRVLHELIEEHRSSGDHEAMRSEAETLLAMDDLDEKAMLAYLESLTLMGDRTLALRRYGEFEKRIARELEAEPSGELRAWVKRLRRDDIKGSAQVAPQPTLTTALPAAQPVFGRASEFRLLWEAWERSRSGRGSVVLLSGEAGIGKSALLLKLTNQVHVAGGSVCYLRCFEAERAIPFAPITSLIRQLARLPGFVATAGVWLGELARLAPELRNRFQSLPEPTALDDSARHRLTDATVHAAQAVADECPLLLAVDDISNADQASLAVLHYLGRQVECLPMLFVATSRRTTDGTYSHSTIVPINTKHSASAVTLSRLVPSETVQLARQVFARAGCSPSDDQITQVIALSGGNPLQAIETAIGLSAGLAPAVATNASNFDSSVSERLALLAPEARSIAQVLAIAGRPLSEYEVVEVTGLVTAELAIGLTALEGALFAKRVGTDVVLTHEKYSAAIYASLDPATRRVLHLRLARVQARSASTNGSAHCDVARHLERGGRDSEAASHARAAAKYASTIGAVRSTADALELLERVGHLDEHALATLGICYLGLGDLDALDRLVANARSARDLSVAALAELEYLDIAADAQRVGPQLPQLESRLLPLVLGADFTHRVEAAVLLMLIADKTGNYEVVRRTVRLLRRNNRAVVEGHAQFATGYLFAKYYWPAKAIEHLRSGLGLLQQSGNWMLEPLCRDCIGISLKNLGCYRESVAHFDHALALARKVMSPLAEARSLQNRAVSEIALGDIDRAWNTLEEIGSLEVGGLFTDFTTYNRGVVLFLKRDYSGSLDLFVRTLERAESRKHALLAGDACGFAALACQRMGQIMSMEGFVARLPLLEPEDRRVRIAYASHAAYAWKAALVDGNPGAALLDLQRWCRQVRRRDISLWLSLELELILLEEASTARRATTSRRTLAATARRYEASLVEQDAQAK